MTALEIGPDRRELPGRDPRQPATREVAELVDERLREAVTAARGMLMAAWLGQVWVPLGYPDWQDYLADVFGPDGPVVQLPPAMRRLADAKWRQAAALVRRQGGRGLTCLELEAETGWGHGTASGALHAAEKKGAVHRIGTFRAGYIVYLADGLTPDA